MASRVRGLGGRRDCKGGRLAYLAGVNKLRMELIYSLRGPVTNK